MAARWLRPTMVLACLAGLAAIPGCRDATFRAGRPWLAPAVGAVPLPAGVLGFGATRSLDALNGFLESLVPGKRDAGRFLERSLQKAVAGTKDLEWLDRTRPIRVVLLDFKRFPIPVVAVVPHKGMEAVLASLPSRAAPDAANQFRYEVFGKPRYLNFRGDEVVMSAEPGAFDAARAFLEGDVARYDVRDAIDLQVSVTNLLAVAGPEVDALEARLGRLGEPPPYAKPAPADTMRDPAVMRQAMKLYFDLFRELDVVRLDLKSGDGYVVAGVGAVARTGTGVARFAADTLRRKPEAYRLLPAGGLLSGAVDIDPAWFVDRFPAAWEVWGRLLRMEPATVDRLKQISRDLAKVQEGDGGLWIGGENGRLRALAVGVVKDVARYRALQGEALDILLTAALRRLAGADAAAAPAKAGGLADRLVALNPVLAKAGVSLARRDDAVAGLELEALDVRIGPPPERLPGWAERALALLGDRMTLAFATRADGRYVMAFGPDGVGEAARAACGEGSDGGAGLDALLRRFAPGVSPALVYRADLRRLIDLVLALVPTARGFPTLPADLPPMVVTAGARNDRTLDLVVAVPTGLFELFRRPSLPPPPPPPPPKPPLVPAPPSAG